MQNVRSRAMTVVFVVAALILPCSVPTPAQNPVGNQDRQATERVLYSFTGGSGNGDGVFPYGGLVRDSAGNLYGTTYQGGSNAGFAPATGCGTVFKITPDGKETVLYEFSTADPGCNSAAGLVLDAAGNLYGTEYTDQNTSCCQGAVFKLDPSGKETELRRFTPIVGDIGNPNSTLTRDAAGNLFGTAAFGGNSSSNAEAGAGGIFRIDPSGNYSYVYLFNGQADGATPYRSRLLLDESGNLYGTTTAAGDLNCLTVLRIVTLNGCGVVFQVTSQGQETVLHAFHGGGDGKFPVGDMARDRKGALYGVTQAGGKNGNGVVFRVSPSGQETIVYTFGPGLDGQPMGGLILDSVGNLYGTTTLGGAYHRGSIFKIAPDGNKTEIYSFTGGADGGRPFGTLIQDERGHLYGTTVDGGAYQQGAVFEVIP